MKITRQRVAALRGSESGDEFENVEIRHSSDASRSNPPQCATTITRTFVSKRDIDNNISADLLRDRGSDVLQHGLSHCDVTGAELERQKESSSGYVSETGDLLRDIVKTKELDVSKKRGPLKTGSFDSDTSDTSNLVRLFCPRGI